MANPQTKNGHHLSSKHYQNQSKSRHISNNLIPRRSLAWLLEVSILATSVFIPYTIGVVINNLDSASKVPLHPILAQTQDGIHSVLALEKPDPSNQQVVPLTNLFWWVTLITPVGLMGWQMYLLAKTGQTTPKRWLGVRVVNGNGQIPGLVTMIKREVGGRWGIPLGVAYVVWRFGGAFPSLTILAGLSGLMLLAEGGMVFLGDRRRTFHDYIANTFVLDGKQPLINRNYTYTHQTINVSLNDNNYLESASESQLQTIVLTTRVEKGINLWQWMKTHPGTTLLIFTSTGMLSVLATFVGTQIYIQSQANFRDSKQQNNQLFLTLVKQLSTTNSNSLEQRRAAILALARLDDPRSGSMLVDLLGQETEPALIETIQQAIVSNGVESLAPLRRLNQSLSNDLKSLANFTKESEVIALRLRATKRAIAKLLTIHSGKVNQTSLHRINLGQVTLGSAQFTLVLDQVDLSGVNFRSAILSNASFRNSSFYNLGVDNRFGTFDDLSSDLSGANLQEADLTGAFLSKISFNRSNLVRANLNKANLTAVNLTGANLSSALIINSNLEKANLQNASLTGANLSESNLNSANLQQANLGKITALGTNLDGANMLGSSMENANLSAANLTKVNLQKANLTNSNLMETNLTNAQLQNAKLSYSNLSKADLRGANLNGADFQGVIFSLKEKTNLEQFVKAPPIQESITKLEGVDFSKVKNLDASQLEIICQAGAIHPSCK
jgi:uncharacterized protein YjbI with pentapeptide repeats/uncharacterized RDD family membrane protein YckC